MIQTEHSFHIPVMGTAFTIDTPLKVARYGITSVISLVDDHLIESVRRYHARLAGVEAAAIRADEADSRARRITAYLDFLSVAVQNQMAEMKSQELGKGSEIDLYFEWMPEDSPLKSRFREYLAMPDSAQKKDLELLLKEGMVPGRIDVNIMTKADCLHTKNGCPDPENDSDAKAALRGFAKSRLESAVVFSAGLNPKLFEYAASFSDFFETELAPPKKRIILKVSDFRSACVQAKIFAKKGIWISEYRVESGINCGGHAFPTDGKLLGPVLEEFKQSMPLHLEELAGIYRQALAKIKGVVARGDLRTWVTAQGGIGTHSEHRFLLRHYGLRSVGWGSPFLLVPEATTVDEETLHHLAEAGEKDIYLSHSSPLGVPFYNLKNSASERMRAKRIADGRPGSPCLNRFVSFNTEFGESLCVSSSRYQSLKLKQIESGDGSSDEKEKLRGRVLEKSCICRDLGDGALIKYDLPDKGKVPSPAVCPGPNLAYFSKIVPLRDMVSHIYGRLDLKEPAMIRPHVFLKEIKLYLDFLREKLNSFSAERSAKEMRFFEDFRDNLQEGIEYYRRLVSEFSEESVSSKQEFLGALERFRSELSGMMRGLEVART